MDIRNLLDQQAKKYAQKPALIFQEKEISFTELSAQTLKLAAALKGLGAQKGDRIGIYLPNCPEYVYSYFAVFCLGAVGVPLDFLLKADELISCLGHCEAKFLIVLPKNDLDLAEVKKSVTSLRKIILLGSPSPVPDTVSYGELLATAKNDLPVINVGENDPALIMYTSGTTGKPKGIRLNYKHLEGSPAAMHHFVDLSDRDVKLAAIPFSHIGGFIYIQNCLLFGIKLVIMARFNPMEFLQLIEQYKVTCFHIVPPMYVALLTLKHIEKFNLSSLRWAVVFGAPSSPAMLERFHKFCPNAQLLNGWGMTETCPPNTVTPLGCKNIASVGKPAPHCRIKIIDADQKELPAGETGEVVISGWVIMDSYYKDPQLTAETIRNGWLHTGDLGRFDPEGFLYIVGRKKEMIKVGGQIVFAPEVEAAFFKHEAVAEAAVIGVADELRGEAVKAFVVLKEGHNITAEELRYFAREHLAHFKVPQTIEIWKDLPRNRTGKIDKEALKISR